MGRFIRWWYHDGDGVPVFQHYRVDDPRNPRGKRYGYRTPTAIRDGKVLDWTYTKPLDADRLVYRLPLLLRHPRLRLIVTEGERCADAALDRGFLATTHHGGAGKFTPQQAESLAHHRGEFWLIADNDVAGAYDVCQRFDLLRAVGIPASRLRVCEVRPSHKGADLRDHLEAGYDLDDLRPANLNRLRELAEAATGDPSEGSWGMSSEEAKQVRGWQPTIVRRSR